MPRTICAFVLFGLLTACGGDGGGGASSSELEVCVTETNRYRAMDGKGPIARSTDLEAYATEGAREDTQSQEAHGHFGRETSGGNFLALAENACPSWLGWNVGDEPDAVKTAIADCIKAFYDEGPGGGHYDNLMGDYAKVGCGVYLDGSGGITIVQDLGN
jgi:uncharacterized protein YkwD